MRKTVFVLLLMVACGACGAPIDSREIGLLLRGGISSSEIARDVQSRKLARLLTADEEAMLKGAGASDQLLSMLKSSAVLLNESDAAKFTAREKEQAELQKLSARPKVWVYGPTSAMPDGGVIIPSGLIKTDRVDPNAAPFHGSVYFSKSPPTATTVASSQPWVNCEAVIVGDHTIIGADGTKGTFTEAVMVNDLGGIDSLPAKASIPAVAGKRSEITISLNRWVAVLPVGGQFESINVSEVGTDYIVAAVGRKNHPRRIAVKTGADNGVDNLTPIANADDGRELFFVNTPRNHAGNATFLIVDPTTP